MAHLARMNHQYKIFDYIKENLSEEDILLHIDFAENVVTKYIEEPQSVHIGASREQITFHTGISYLKSSNSKAFCTISTSLRHDPSAIIAHITPVLESHLELQPQITHLHIVSDGPTT